jgi:hypothetical protein
MLRQFLRPLLCGVVFVGKVHAQEVIVPREKKQEAPVPTPTIQPSERISSETPTPASRKSRSREKKSASATLTLEEMRTAGERAAEGLNDRSVSKKTRQPDTATAPLPSPVVAETPRPVKRETPMEQRRSSPPSKPASTNPEGLGPIRPSMMESGREAPSPSPPGR